MKTPLQINDELLIGCLLNEVSAEQAQQVAEWRAADTVNEQRYEQFRLIWESSKNFKADAGIDAQASLQSVKQKAAEQKMQHAAIVPIRKKIGWLSVAAATLLIAGSAWLYFTQFGNRQLQLETQAMVKTDTLPDGSVITLNKYALFNYPAKFTGNERKVALIKGEAFFNITHNKTRPFIITAGKTSIKVVGTSFNVNYRNGNMEVIVETGIVQVSMNGKSVLLKHGEMVSVKKGAVILLKEANHDSLYNYYYSKEFVANNVPLQRLVKVLNEAYDSHIVIGRQDLNNEKINATLRSDLSLDQILKLISLTLNIEIEKKQGLIILK
jgi:ferric-dicitrate binding protein FerR (iron transport regulator)